MCIIRTQKCSQTLYDDASPRAHLIHRLKFSSADDFVYKVNQCEVIYSSNRYWDSDSVHSRHIFWIWAEHILNCHELEWYEDILRSSQNSLVVQYKPKTKLWFLVRALKFKHKILSYAHWTWYNLVSHFPFKCALSSHWALHAPHGVYMVQFSDTRGKIPTRLFAAKVGSSLALIYAFATEMFIRR